MRSSFLTIESFFVSPLLIEDWAFCGLVASTFERGGRRALGLSRVPTACSAKRWPPRARWCSLRPARLGLEGVVSKRAGSLYKSGKSRNWLKTKNPNFVRT